MSVTAEPPPVRKAIPANESRELDDYKIHPLVSEYAASDTLVLLLAIRFINAICVRTFFQPDEYFQSLEPAWQMAFGAESGAWITWACRPPLFYIPCSNEGIGMASPAQIIVTSRSICSCLHCSGKDDSPLVP